MTQKCDGVKILDLEGKNSFTGAEYAVIAEKDANYKIPLEQIGDVIINSSKFKAKVDRAYTASVPTASVALEDNEFTLHLVFLLALKVILVIVAKMVKTVKTVEMVQMEFLEQMEILSET